MNSSSTTPERGKEERDRLLNADYSSCDIIELCWIHARALKEEDYEICAKIVQGLKNRVLDDYDKRMLKEYLIDKDNFYPYMYELNGLLNDISLKF